MTSKEISIRIAGILNDYENGGITAEDMYERLSQLNNDILYFNLKNVLKKV